MMLKRKLKKIVLRVARRLMNWANDFSYNFEQNGEKWIQNAVDGLDFKVFFDVGANIGNWTREARSIHSNTKFHCFELSKETYDTLKKNINLSDVILNNIGLSNISGDVEYKDYGNNSGGNTLLTNSVFHDKRKKPKIRYGKVVKGDDYCEINGIHFIDFLKIDVEGVEHLVLEGFSEMLSKGNIRIIQFEYGYTNGDTKFLMRDFYYLFNENKYIVGKLMLDSVDFMEWNYNLNDFTSGPNFIAIKESDKELFDILSAR